MDGETVSERGKKYHFVGIGGIGMSALARLLLQQGHQVSGTDQTESPLLASLEKEGASVRVGHGKEALPLAAEVVYSSGVPLENEELAEAKRRALPVWHRADLLAALMAEKRGIVVAGSHGKTTTTALLTEVLRAAGEDPAFAVGGILRSLGTNAGWGKGRYFVAEGDESDGSFLRLPKTAAIVTNIGDDHLDFWKTKEALVQAFQDFCEKAPLLVWCADDPLLSGPPELSYGFSERAFWRIAEWETLKEGISFRLRGEKIFLPLFGAHNAKNGAAVFALAHALGLPKEKTLAALASFQGTKRRLELLGSAKGLSLYEDYGHHPTEIQATLSALKEKEKERRLVAVFQPHRYSRFARHFEAFAASFSEADLLVVTDVYGAGESPLTAPSVFEFVEKTPRALYVPRETLVEELLSHVQPLDAVVFLGAGDLGKSGRDFLSAFEQRGKKLRIGLFFGGASNEHAVSIQSAAGWEKALLLDRYEIRKFPIARDGSWSQEGISEIDAAVPILHGPRGEDGMIQGFFETLQIPYVGCDYRGAAVCMHKVWTKEVARGAGVPTSRFISIDRFSYRKNPAAFCRRVEDELRYPVWVKAVHCGSSLGVMRAASAAALPLAIENAFQEDDTLLVEEEIQGKEIEFSLLGNDWVEAAPPAELLTGGGFYDFEKKYGAQAVQVQIPAPLPEELTLLGKDLAKTVYRAAGCKGLARIDFFLDEAGHFWLNEINPFPGFTPSSGYPKMWEAAGLSYSALVDRLIMLALQRRRASR